jgi:hypothetical protein
MSYKVKLPLYLSWSALKKLLGWPYGRTHTGRLMFDPAELSPSSHPAMRRVLALFEPCWLGGATGRGAEPST